MSQPLVVNDTEENFCLKMNIIILFCNSDKEVALAAGGQQIISGEKIWTKKERNTEPQLSAIIASVIYFLLPVLLYRDLVLIIAHLSRHISPLYQYASSSLLKEIFSHHCLQGMSNPLLSKLISFWYDFSLYH